jgi:predicted O-methyltransferase YrrM
MYPLILIKHFISHCIMVISDKTEEPFIREFQAQVLKNKSYDPGINRIQEYITLLHRNHSPLESSSFGAGSRLVKKSRTISQTVRLTAVNKKYGSFLYHLALYFKPDSIVEMGTALGISTLYLACGNPKARLITIEADAQLSSLACEGFKMLGYQHIITMNETFLSALEKVRELELGNTLIFLDGEHTYEATWHYYQACLSLKTKSIILVFDDIRWSSEMLRAWRMITQSPDAGTTIDLFSMGIVFPGLSAKKISLWY